MLYRSNPPFFNWFKGAKNNIILNAIDRHPAIAESAAIVLPHPLKGNAIHITVVLRNNYQPSKELEHGLTLHVEEHLGKITRPETVQFTDVLPKTRNGKISADC